MCPVSPRGPRDPPPAPLLVSLLGLGAQCLVFPGPRVRLPPKRNSPPCWHTHSLVRGPTTSAPPGGIDPTSCLCIQPAKKSHLIDRCVWAFSLPTAVLHSNWAQPPDWLPGSFGKQWFISLRLKNEMRISSCLQYSLLV